MNRFDSSHYIEKGKAYFAAGTYRKALRCFLKALALERADILALFEAGKAFYVLREYAKAIGFLKKSAAALRTRHPLFRHAVLLMAKSYRSLRDYDHAITYLQQISARGKRDPMVEEELKKTYNDKYANLPDISRFGYSYSALIKEYEKRITAGWLDTKSIAHLAQIYNYLGRYRRTVSLARRSLPQIPAGEVFFRNKLLNELEIAQGKTLLSSKVRSLSVTLSNRCNISCIMCQTRKHRWELPEKRVNEIVALFPYLEKVMWQGGEVFALPYFGDLAAEASKYPNIRQCIVTNGQLITPAVAEHLVRNNVELTFSVDGARRETYEHIRRGASFDRLLRTLAAINELRREHHSSFAMNMNVAVMRSNYRELTELVRFAARHRFDFVCLMPIHTHEKTEENVFTDVHAVQFLAHELKNASAYARKRGVRLENRLPVGPAQQRRKAAAKRLCHIPWFQLLLDYDGTVRPDCLCPEENTAGSLAVMSLGEIWNSGILQNYRRRMRTGHYRRMCNPLCGKQRVAEQHFKLV